MKKTIKDTGDKGTILYIGGFELPDKNAAAHRVLSNAKLFRLLEYNTVLIGVDKSRTENIGVLNTKKVIAGFVTYSIKYPTNMKQWIEYISKIDDYIEIMQSLSNLKIIVCYNFPAIALERIRKYCRKNGLKCIADVTEWYTGLGRSIPVKIVKGIDTFLRMRIIHKKIDGLIVISRYLENYYNKCKDVVYIPPLVDLNEKKWENKREKSSDILYLVYAGNPGKKDRIDFLIEALSQVQRKYQLDIIGIEKNEYVSLYNCEMPHLDQNHIINFHGRLSHLEALKIVKHANYSCFFRISDRVTMAGFPTKFSEAISCGTPVITNRSSNIEDYLINQNGYLVDNLSCKAISHIINIASFTFETNSNLFDYRRYRSKMKLFFEKL